MEAPSMEEMETQVVRTVADFQSGDAKRVIGAAHDMDSLIVQVTRGTPAALGRRKHHNVRSRELEDFLALQDSFAFNIVGHAALQLEWCLTTPDVDAAAAMIGSIRGLCLIHRPSRLVFNNDRIMNMVIRGIRDPRSPPLQQAFINVAMAAMVRQVETIRRFEAMRGLKAVSDTFKRSATPRAVKLTLLQFLFFYLIPETRGLYVEGSNGSEQAVPRKTTKDKQEMLGRYLSNVDGLVRQLETLRPYGSADIEW